MTTVPVESDLWIPLPAEGDKWNPHTVHTHYFGFSIPEEKLGAFIYTRYQPVYKITTGGVCIFKGLDNLRPLDCEHVNFINTMPYPEFVGNALQLENGLRVQFIELGKKVVLQYKSKDGKTSFDLTQTAVTALLPRGHVMPGEDTDTDPAQKAGGSEQFMHCVGDFTLDGQHYKVDCLPVRDRSWRQTRSEDEIDYPPVGWSPMCFGGDLSFNQVGYEAPDANPIWEGVFNVDKKKPSFYFAWIVVEGEARDIVRVKRRVTRYHPDLFAAVEQEIEAEDAAGRVYRFKGEAIAMAQLPSWPNGIFVDSVYKWTDEQGRVAHCAYQEAWYHRYQRQRRGRLGSK